MDLDPPSPSRSRGPACCTSCVQSRAVYGTVLAHPCDGHEIKLSVSAKR